MADEKPKILGNLSVHTYTKQNKKESNQLSVEAQPCNPRTLGAKAGRLT